MCQLQQRFSNTFQRSLLLGRYFHSPESIWIQICSFQHRNKTAPVTCPAQFPHLSPPQNHFSLTDFLKPPLRFKLKNKGPDKIAYFLLYILSMWSIRFAAWENLEEVTHRRCQAGFPGEGGSKARLCEQFIPDHNSECSALLVIAVRAWFNLRLCRAADLYAFTVNFFISLAGVYRGIKSPTAENGKIDGATPPISTCSVSTALSQRLPW